MPPMYLYMILTAIGNQRGEPIALFYDAFQARSAFSLISDVAQAFTGNNTAFLVMYELGPYGLREVQELARK
jgi:hypothetical protein